MSVADSGRAPLFEGALDELTDRDCCRTCPRGGPHEQAEHAADATVPHGPVRGAPQRACEAARTRGWGV